MKAIRKRLPTPALIIAVIALIAAVSGTAVAGGVLTNKSFKKKSVRGPVTYVNTTQSVLTPGATATTITSPCPGGSVPIGGSAKTLTPSNTSTFFLFDDYPSATGWTASVYAGPPAENVTVTAICAKSKKTSGAPPTITP